MKQPSYTMDQFAADLVEKRPSGTPEKEELVSQLGLSPAGGAAFALACMFLAPLDDDERLRVITLLLQAQHDPAAREAAFKRRRGA